MTNGQPTAQPAQQKWHEKLLQDMGGWQGVSALLANMSGVAAAPTVSEGLQRASTTATEFARSAQAQRKIQQNQKFWDDFIQLMGGAATAEGTPGPNNVRIDRKGDGTTNMAISFSEIMNQMSDEATAARGAGSPGAPTASEEQFTKAMALREMMSGVGPFGLQAQTTDKSMTGTMPGGTSRVAEALRDPWGRQAEVGR